MSNKRRNKNKNERKTEKKNEQTYKYLKIIFVSWQSKCTIYGTISLYLSCRRHGIRRRENWTALCYCNEHFNIEPCALLNVDKDNQLQADLNRTWPTMQVSLQSLFLPILMSLVPISYDTWCCHLRDCHIIHTSAHIYTHATKWNCSNFARH